MSARKIQLRLVGGATLMLILISGAVFSATEGWTYWESFYFVFITISTIGFGDFVPAKETGRLFLILFILIGLGLCTELINLLGNKFEKTVQGSDVSRKLKKIGQDTFDQITTSP